MDWHFIWSIAAIVGGSVVTIGAFRRLLKLCAQSRWRYTIKYACAMVGGMVCVLGGLDIFSATAMLGGAALCWAIDMLSSANLWRGGAPSYTQRATPLQTLTLPKDDANVLR